jgi:hypothetical protein
VGEEEAADGSGWRVRVLFITELVVAARARRRKWAVRMVT